MDSVVLGAQVLLSVLFATAGVGKLADLPGSRRALADFGVPTRALPLAAFALPLVELATAIALLIPPATRAGAVAAMALLLAFIVGIARALARGETPDCHCFGQIHSAPAGRGTLVRNLALAVPAVLLLVHGSGPSLGDWAAARSSAELVAVCGAIAAALSTTTAVRFWFDNRGLRREVEEARAAVASLPPGLPVGTRAPGFALPDLRGEVVTLESLTARGMPLVLVFATPDCGGCKALLPDLGRWQATLSDRVTVAVVSIGTPEQNRPAFEEHGVHDVMLQDAVAVMNDYRVRATPSAVVVAADGTIGSAPAEGAITIEPLIRMTLRRAAHVPNAEAPLQPSLGS